MSNPAEMELFKQATSMRDKTKQKQDENSETNQIQMKKERETNSNGENCERERKTLESVKIIGKIDLN